MLLLHISDIHFKRGEVGSALDPNLHLRNELVRDAEQMCAALGRPDAVLISGDIAFAGHREEYEFALTWLEELCHRCGTSLSAVFICPGNHDVIRNIASRNIIQALHRDIKQTSALSLDGLLRGLLADEETGRLLYESISSYNLFAVQFFCDLVAPDRTIATRDLILNDGSVLRLWGLNSTFVSSIADARGQLYVDPTYVRIIREAGVEHLVMCHHPYEWLCQGDVLRDHLNDVARLHLFGHDHRNRIEVGRDWIRVTASAAHPDRTEPGWEPGYNFIRLTIQGDGAERRLALDVHVRVWQTAPGRFRPKMDRESEVFKQTIPLAPWARPEPEVIEGAAAAPEADRAHEVEIRSDAMTTLREISVRFFKLTLSQKSAIAGKLGLLEDEDVNQPDFERFRRVFLRARDRNLVEALEREITAVEKPN